MIPSRAGWVLCWCFTHDGLGNALCHKSPQLLLPPPLLLCVRQVSDISHSHFVFFSLSRGLELFFEDDNMWVINFQCLTIPGKVVNISCPVRDIRFFLFVPENRQTDTRITKRAVVYEMGRAEGMKEEWGVGRV